MGNPIPINRYGDPMDYYDARADLHTLGMVLAGLETTTDWAAIRRDQRPLLAIRIPEPESEQEYAETLLQALLIGIIDGIARKWNIPYPETLKDRNELLSWATNILKNNMAKLPVPCSQSEAISKAFAKREQQKNPSAPNESQQGSLSL